MAYTKFTLEKLYETFDLSVGRGRLFGELQSIEPSRWLTESLEIYQEVPMTTEKARSEGVVMPILTELSKRNQYKFRVFSGVIFNVDVKKGLSGETDYLLATSPDMLTLSSPIFAVVEAKKQDLYMGLPQCLAQLVASQKFNEKHNRSLTLFGCVTTATEWQFLKLDGKNFTIDTKLYHTDNLPQLLGVMQWVVDQTSL